MSDDLFQVLLKLRGPDKSDGSQLEMLGKQAADRWLDGRADNLSDAVVQTVKSAGLNTEQVRRVIEFTNIEAYNREFKKESSSKVINFEGGPADPSVVLKDLNRVEQKVACTLASDYDVPPEPYAHVSVSTERAFDQAFATQGGEYPEVNPFGEVLDLRDKLASAHDQMTGELSSLEVDFQEASRQLLGHVKQAALAGHSLSEIVHIWNGVAPDQVFVKTAMESMLEPLLSAGVFTGDELVESLQKVAAPRVPNPEHPLVQGFAEYCETLAKLAELRDRREEVADVVGDLTEFLKAAELGGVAGAIGRGAEALMNGAGFVGEHAGKLIAGNSERAATWGRRAGKAALIAGGAMGANEAYRNTLKYDPRWQRAVRAVRAATPFTQDYYNREYELMLRANGGMMY